MIQIPVTVSGNSDYDITLEGKTYTIQYRFNNRNKRLYMNILSNGVEVISGLRLIENLFVDLIYSSSDTPQGKFFVSQLTESVETSTLGNTGINKTFSNVYLASTEIEE